MRSLRVRELREKVREGKLREEGRRGEARDGERKGGAQGRGWRKTVSLRRGSQRTRRGASRGGSTTAQESDVCRRNDLSLRAHKAEHPIFNFPFVLLKILNLFK